MPNPRRDTTAGRVFNDLLNLARRTGRGTDELLLAYSLERFLYRVGAVARTHFVLKGGMLLALFEARRPTRDIDLLGQAIAANDDEIRKRAYTGLGGLCTFFSGDATRGEDQAGLPRSSADRLAGVRRLWTPRWVMIHAAAVILVVGFLGLGWWQVRRAADGNTLSFGYAIEWPIFAAFVLYVWVKEIRRTRRESARPAERLPAGRTTAESPAWPPVATAAPNGRRRRNEAAYDDSGDEDLAAYNRYLAWLNAHPHASPTEYPD